MANFALVAVRDIASRIYPALTAYFISNDVAISTILLLSSTATPYPFIADVKYSVACPISIIPNLASIAEFLIKVLISSVLYPIRNHSLAEALTSAVVNPIDLAKPL